MHEDLYRNGFNSITEQLIQYLFFKCLLLIKNYLKKSCLCRTLKFLIQDVCLLCPKCVRVSTEYPNIISAIKNIFYAYWTFNQVSYNKGVLKYPCFLASFVVLKPKNLPVNSNLNFLFSCRICS